ncbi:hypothetical protein WNY37_04835 [Henriciella sp. AS95]|uniref:hypothetical protein n=1 Tax=Henriciella sp. AS95 TaxID=3135782 RepID=UPI003172A9FE
MKPNRAALLVSLTCLALSAHGSAAFAESDLQINLSASVASSCGLSSAETTPNANGATMRISTVCNASGFTLTFDGVPGLDISGARSAHISTGPVSVLADSVMLTPVRPGLQAVDIDFSNSAAELSDLIIGIDAQ